MIHPNESYPVALICYDKNKAKIISEKLRWIGRSPILLSDGVQFLREFGRGKNFGLMVLLLDGGSEWAHLVALAKSMRVPALLLVTDAHSSMPIDELVEMCGQDVLNSPIDLAFFPANELELDWRIRILLQRAENPAPLVDQMGLKFGEYRFFGINQVFLPTKKEVFLKPREFELALLFFKNCGKTLTREWIDSSLWGGVLGVKTRAIDVCVSNIRRKLSLEPRNGFVLQPAYKRGYHLSRVLPLAPVDDFSSVYKVLGAGNEIEEAPQNGIE
ncbi:MULTISPECIES: DNA-binding response regulator [unclassified Variovorax]|uniref:DNA-binding response regulator n=1 Tax=unclassified Variovorax TaxID=663243 RepID=UPI0034E93218